MAKLDGSYQAKIYIYDARPLPKLRIGDTVKLTATIKPIEMVSHYTGMVCDGTDDICFLYKGKPIGYVPLYDSLKGFMRRHKNVTVTAVRTGTYAGDGFKLPELKVNLPSKQEAKRYNGIVAALIGRFIGR